MKIRKLKIAALVLFGFTSLQISRVIAQEYLPQPPADHSPIYVLDDQNHLLPLSFEKGTSPIRLELVARSTGESYLELKGEHSGKTFRTKRLRWFLFTYERAGVHPPFLVRLTAHHANRRVGIITQRGLTGFAISSDEIIKPSLRVIEKLSHDEVFMELRPRVSLIPGEYAIIGDDLTRIATFRIITAGDR